MLYGFFNENFNKEFRELFQKVRIISEKCLFHCLSCHKSRIIESTYLQEIVLFFLFFPIVNIVDSMSREKDFLNGCCWISFVPLCNRKYLKREGALWKVYIYALGGCVLRTDSSGDQKQVLHFSNPPTPHHPTPTGEKSHTPFHSKSFSKCFWIPL